MYKKSKILLVLLTLTLSVFLASCSNLRWNTSAGVGVNFGPHGPKLDPHVSVDLYNGGKVFNNK